MPYTKHMEKCCKFLSESADVTTDHWIRPLIDTENICLDVVDTFSLGDIDNGDVNSDVFWQSLVSNFHSRIRAVKQAIPSPCINSLHGGVPSHILRTVLLT
jgi:hypothetical protein